ncbi:hypothetical protein AALA22_14430 [Anaerovoracaceae bacterium 41-7]
MDYRKMTDEELDRLTFAATSRMNYNAAADIERFRSVYGKRVKVVKGRKVPIGTIGTVFWYRTYDNSKYGDPWGIYSSTSVGIKQDDGTVHFTNYNNVEIIR